MTNCTDQKSPGTWDLAETAGTLGVFAVLVDEPRAWGGDDDPNGPWLPRIPRPRVSPVTAPIRIPRQPEGFAAPVAEDAQKPTIPGQRIPAKVPTQPIRQQAGALTCCGRKLRRSGSQLVCDGCGAWTTAVASLLPVVAGQCGTCQGQGGRAEDTSSGGVTRKNWRSCGTCNGSGVR